MTRQISYEDIRQGDRIRVRWVHLDASHTIEGVAAREHAGSWKTPNGEYLVFRASLAESIIELVERPSPQEPEGLGKIIRHGEDTYVSVYPEPGTLRWCKTPRIGNITHDWFYRWGDFDLESIEIL